MLKIIFIYLFYILSSIVGCGYQPIYKDLNNKNFDFNITVNGIHWKQ